MTATATYTKNLTVPFSVLRVVHDSPVWSMFWSSQIREQSKPYFVASGDLRGADGDDELAACSSGFEVSHGVGHLVERVGLFDRRHQFAALDQFCQALEDGAVLFGAEHGQSPADKR